MTGHSNSFFDTVVSERRQEAENVISLALSPASDAALPPWAPGAHIDVRLPSGVIRQYSLCGTGENNYTIAVLRDPNSRGGSIEIHDAVPVGTVLAIRHPRNKFPLVEASDYVFLAGGIGITPILSMVRHLDAIRKPWTLHYGGRSRSTMAFLGELERMNGTTLIVPEDECGLLDLPTILSSTAHETAIYCCGPAGLIQAVNELCNHFSRKDNLYTERFTASGFPTSDSSSTFEVRLARSGFSVFVRPEQSILEAVREVVADVPSSCEDGYCGTCETRVLEGVPDHHDDYLSDEERASNERMMICVGRAKTPLIVLDI
ncbi:PDR/VanB family oxidoreductase [Amycolatopsis sacchari]|uniref:Ferredoxin-NADP reductase n=1 Tax=Amycolatopsis sacchari TaxID=115433 RepID=A0A1I3UCP6_9PSEU|nr:PDR/VanB family oxidoreductase [Amycolatopsis sacchari]SFJ81298.1 Ferredoxin-NADP reductase [Amycolatopsis sacchari]